MQQKKPTAPVKPSLVTQPSPTLITRNVKRFTAFCPVSDGSCEFNVRRTPQLHTSKGSASVEAGRHIRAAHADMLFAERVAKRQRQVVNESIQLIADEPD